MSGGIGYSPNEPDLEDRNWVARGWRGAPTDPNFPFPFPAAVGLTHLRVYTESTVDGVAGGSPHVHLASVEAYIPTKGQGEVRTLGRNGEQIFRLEPGRIVWFEPGVIHRLVNLDGQLELLVVMQNDGLPEAGDAVMTFPEAILGHSDRYREAVTLSGDTRAERQASAIRRRDLAIQGYAEWFGGENPAGELERFFRMAQALKREEAERWIEIVKSGPLMDVAHTQARIKQVVKTDPGTMLMARVRETSMAQDHAVLGMCGYLDPFKPGSAETDG